MYLFEKGTITLLYRYTDTEAIYLSTLFLAQFPLM
jgi:hypothetical protein